MKIIQPSCEILAYPEATDKVAVSKFIESIGRTCYKSEDKITDDSYKRFITNLVDNKHTSVLEHYTFVARLTKKEFKKVFSDQNVLNPYNKFVNVTEYEKSYLLSYSMASKLNLMNLYDDELYYLINDLETRSNNGEKIYLTQAEIASLPIEEQLRHRYMTVRFIVDRGIMAEMTRHRQASFSVESTRYANYSLDKFGKEISVVSPFVTPGGYPPDDKNYFTRVDYDKFLVWKTHCEACEKAYMQLLDMKVKPELARSVLPMSLKTELVMTAPMWSWLNFFNLRTSSRAHPQIKMISEKLYYNCTYKGYDNFVNLDLLKKDFEN